MNESEAKNKWCPYSGMQHNPQANVDCIGQRCMAWRWLPFEADDAWLEAVKSAAKEIGDNSPNRHKAAVHVGKNRGKYGLPETPTHGYCGLAGKP